MRKLRARRCATIRRTRRDEIAGRRGPYKIFVWVSDAGQMNAQKINAILWPTWVGGRKTQVLLPSRTRQVVDTTNYFCDWWTYRKRCSSAPSKQQKALMMKFPFSRLRTWLNTSTGFAHRRAAPFPFCARSGAISLGLACKHSMDACVS